jgi:hypothetical protein
VPRCRYNILLRELSKDFVMLWTLFLYYWAIFLFAQPLSPLGEKHTPKGNFFRSLRALLCLLPNNSISADGHGKSAHRVFGNKRGFGRGASLFINLKIDDALMLILSLLMNNLMFTQSWRKAEGRELSVAKLFAFF